PTCPDGAARVRSRPCSTGGAPASRRGGPGAAVRAGRPRRPLGEPGSRFGNGPTRTYRLVGFRCTVGPRRHDGVPMPGPETPAHAGAMRLQVRGLTVRFGGLAALTDVDLDVADGQVVGLIGPNGAGKTTVFNAVCGLVRPTAGTVTVAGRPAPRSP